MPMSSVELKRMIQDAFPDAEIEIRALAEDDDHYSAKIVSEQFRDRNRIQQHQMVYEALKGRMGEGLHALSLQTAVPDRARQGE